MHLVAESKWSYGVRCSACNAQVESQASQIEETVLKKGVDSRIAHCSSGPTMTALNSLNTCGPPEAQGADEAAWSQLVYRLKSARAEERLIALEEASGLLGAAIARGELDGESANRCMIALFTAAAAIGDGIPRVSASRFACDC